MYACVQSFKFCEKLSSTDNEADCLKSDSQLPPKIIFSASIKIL